MRIELISQEEFHNLLNIYNDYPALFLQNDGYEYIDKSKFTEEDQEKFNEVEAILEKHISGFNNFSNFRKNKKTGEIEIRFQYNYNYDNDIASFIGVGYILLDELLNGFREENGSR